MTAVAGRLWRIYPWPFRPVGRLFQVLRAVVFSPRLSPQYLLELPKRLSRADFFALPAGFQDADVGAVGLAGSSSYNSSSGTFTVKGAGTDLFGSTDAFHFVYTTLTGNGSFSARLDSISASSSSAPSGIDMRSSLSPGAANMFDAVQPNGGPNIINDRTNDGGVENNVLVNYGPTAPYYLELVRTGDVISVYISNNNGAAYGLDKTETFPGLPNSIVVGLAVASQDPTQLATATFDQVQVHAFTSPPASIQEADIGVVGSPGFTNYDSSSGTFAVTGAGNDLFGSTDAFHFDYTTLSGDGSLVVRETSDSAFDQTAPSGIDLRTSLDPTAANLFVAARPDTHVIVNDRPTDGGDGVNATGTDGQFPIWLKITRTGDTVVGAISTDGVNFTTETTQTFTLPNTVYVGMAVASHDPVTPATATFDNFTLVGNEAASAALTTAPNITAAQSTPYQFTVTYTEGSTPIDATTIGGNDITVTGPGGYSQAATLVSSGLQDGPMVVATYSVPTPTTNGNYTISLNQNSVDDTSATAVPGGMLGTFNAAVSVDNVAPTATLESHPPVTSTTAPYVFAITFSDNIAVNASTIASGNAQVTGPNGYNQPATLISTGLANGASVVAQYSVPAPTTVGTYTISMVANQVLDTSGNPVLPSTLGTFALSNPSNNTASISGNARAAFNNAAIAGRTITLDTGVSTVTDANGNYSFTGLAAGSYTVTETLPAGVVLTDPASGQRSVTLTAGSPVTGFNFVSLPAVAATAPDFTASLSGKTPVAVVGGSKGPTLKFKIANIGTSMAASTPISVTLFASPDGTLSESDAVITTVSAGSLKLKTHASKTVSIKFTYPTSLASGSYKLIGVANSTDSIAETNFANNSASSSAITIAPAFTSLAGQITKTPKTLVHGKSGSATVTVTNSGNVASTASLSISLYESPVASFQSGDILLGTLTRPKNNIKASGGKTSFPVNFKVPSTVTSGNEFIVAVLNGDTVNAVASPTTVAFS